MDHLHPKSFFTNKNLKNKDILSEDIEYYKENFNKVSNLQLLEGLSNEEKSSRDLRMWVNEIFSNEDQKNDYLDRNYIPRGISLDFNNFKEFFEKRKLLIFEKLKKELLSS